MGVQNYPIGGPDRWRIDQDFMTMQMVGIRQEVPNSDKRKARIEVADAAIDRASAQRRVERLKVRQSTALAWISSHSPSGKDRTAASRTGRGCWRSAMTATAAVTMNCAT